MEKRQIQFADTDDSEESSEYAMVAAYRRSTQWDTAFHETSKEKYSIKDAARTFALISQFNRDGIYNLKLFAHVTRRVVQSLQTFLSVVSYCPDDVIATKGEPIDALYFVVVGSCAVEDGDETLYNLLEMDYFGDLFLSFGDSPCFWPHTIIARTSLRLAMISKTNTLHVLDAHPQYYAYLKNINARMSQDAYVERIWNIGCFANCSASLRSEVTGIADIKLCYPGTDLFRQGELIDSVYVLLQGVANVVIHELIVAEVADADTLRVIREPNSDGEASALTVRYSFGATNLLNCIEQTLESAFGQDSLDVNYWQHGVQAKTVCIIGSIKKDLLRRLLQKFPADLLQVQQNQGQSDSSTVDERGPAKCVDIPCDSSTVDERRLGDTSVPECGPFWESRSCWSAMSTKYKCFVESRLLRQYFSAGSQICNMDTEAVFSIASGSVLCDEKLLQAGECFGYLPFGYEGDREGVAQTLVVVHVLYKNVLLNALECFPEERRIFFDDLQVVCAGDKPPRDILNLENGFFANASDAFINAMTSSNAMRIYTKNDCILEQDAAGQTMVILNSGSASAKQLQSNRLVTLGQVAEGAVMGEISVLGDVDARRNSYVVVESKWSSVLVVQKDALLAAFAQFSPERECFRDALRIRSDQVVARTIIEHSVWEGCAARFRVSLAVLSQTQLYFYDDVIVRQSEPDDRMHFLIHGKCRVKFDGEDVGAIDAPSTFGFTLMTGDTKRHLASRVALALCHYVTISRGAFEYALKKCPQETNRLRKKTKVEMASVEYLQGHYKLLSARKQLCAGKKVDTPIFSAAKNLLERALAAWRRRTVDLQEYRKQRIVWLELAKRKNKSDTSTSRTFEGQIRRHRRFAISDECDSEEIRFNSNFHSKRKDLSYLPWPSPDASPYYSLQMWNIWPELPESVRNMAGIRHRSGK